MAPFFNIFWDARSGGSNIYDLTWDQCVFGAKNASGATGCRTGLLLQPSPGEHDAGGPRPNGVDNPNYSFSWASITHGAGQAAMGGAGGYGFRLRVTTFVGATSSLASTCATTSGPGT